MTDQALLPYIIGYWLFTIIMVIALLWTVNRLRISDIRRKLLLREDIDAAKSCLRSAVPNNDRLLLDRASLVRKLMQARITSARFGSFFLIVSFVLLAIAFVTTTRLLADFLLDDPRDFSLKGTALTGLGYLSVLTNPRTDLKLGDSFILDVNLSDGALAKVYLTGNMAADSFPNHQKRCEERFGKVDVSFSTSSFEPLSQKSMREFLSGAAGSCAIDFRWVLTPRSAGEKHILVRVINPMGPGETDSFEFDRKLRIYGSFSPSEQINIVAAILALLGVVGAALITTFYAKQPQSDSFSQWPYGSLMPSHKHSADE